MNKKQRLEFNLLEDDKFEFKIFLSTSLDQKIFILIGFLCLKSNNKSYLICFEIRIYFRREVKIFYL
jgi:hypothetical protein